MAVCTSALFSELGSHLNPFLNHLLLHILNSSLYSIYCHDLFTAIYNIGLGLDFHGLPWSSFLTWILISKCNESSSLRYSNQGAMEDPAQYHRSKILLDRPNRVVQDIHLYDSVLLSLTLCCKVWLSLILSDSVGLWHSIRLDQTQEVFRIEDRLCMI